MSVGAIVNPGFTSPWALPAGLAGGSAVGPSRPATTGPTASSPSSYQAAYSNLTILDNIELIQVAEGTPAAAAANVSSVLAQATALQQTALAAQHAAQLSAGNAPVTTPSVPTLRSLIQQSDADAAAALANHTLGASINTFA